MAEAILSPHLSEREFLTTQHRELIEANRREWLASDAVRTNAGRLASSVFEPVRGFVGRLHVNSGFRSVLLNAAVGGKAESKHLFGLAIDVEPLDMLLEEAMERIAMALEAGELQSLDKAIVECGTWIHLQAAFTGRAPRKLLFSSADGKTFGRYGGRTA